MKSNPAISRVWVGYAHPTRSIVVGALPVLEALIRLAYGSNRITLENNLEVVEVPGSCFHPEHSEPAYRVAFSIKAATLYSLIPFQEDLVDDAEGLPGMKALCKSLFEISRYAP